LAAIFLRMRRMILPERVFGRPGTIYSTETRHLIKSCILFYIDTTSKAVLTRHPAADAIGKGL
jgi:hypothetical protein